MKPARTRLPAISHGRHNHRQLVERLECCVIADRIADTADAAMFPEIAKAQAHLASMTPERRAELNREWEA